MRFITTNAWAGQSKCFDLIAGQISHIENPRACEVVMLYSYLSFASKPLGNGCVFTGLPFKHMVVDKDITMGMQWHIRGPKHDIYCAKKLIMAYRMENSSDHVLVTQSYDKQVIFMKKMAEYGVSYDDFKNLVDTTPDVPHLLLPFFIGMVYEQKEDLFKASIIQQQNKGNLCAIGGDKSCTSKNAAGYYRGEVKSVEVSKMVNKLEAKSLVECIVKLPNSGLMDNTYLTFPKDHKDGNRGIAEMTAGWIAMQKFGENIAKTASTAADEDMLHDHDKYEKIINNVMNILSKKNTAKALSSQDRENHCRYLMPEAMSVAAAVIANIVDLQHFTFLSAILRMNTVRKVIMPWDFDITNDRDSDFLSGVKFGRVKGIKNGVVRDLYSLDLSYHMMEGVWHTFAGVINTVYASGMCSILKDIYPNQILEMKSASTADDVGVVANLSTNHVVNELRNIVCVRSQDELKYCMMKSKRSKDVASEKFLEINNIAITRRGMVSASASHSLLSIQPMVRQNLIEDLLTSLSSATSILAWGESPSLCLVSAELSAMRLQRKYLLTDENVEQMRGAGLLLSNIKECVQGPQIRSPWLMQAIYDRLDAERREELADGNLTFTTAMSRLLGSNKTMRRPLEIMQTDVESFDDMSKSIIRARKRGGAVSGKYLRLHTIGTRISRRNEFLDLLSQQRQPDKEISDLIERDTPEEPYIILRKGYKKDGDPQKMGNKSYELSPPFREAICYKITGCMYRQDISDDVRKLLEMPEDEFRDKYRKAKETDSVTGKTFFCPAGLPRVFYDEGKIYRKQPVMNLRYDVERTPQETGELRKHLGRVPALFKPCYFGSDDIDSNDELAYGTCYIGDHFMIMYCSVAQGKRRYWFERSKLDVSGRIRSRITGNWVRWVRSDDKPEIDCKKYKLKGKNAPGIEGSHSAILNVGKYIHSNRNYAYGIWSEIFTKHNSVLPYAAHSRKIDPDVDCKVIECGKIIIKGWRNVSNYCVRLIPGAPTILLKPSENQMYPVDDDFDIFDL